MLNTSASGSASPVVSTTIPLGRDLLDDLVHRRFGIPQQRATTQPPPSSAIRTLLAFNQTFVSIAIIAELIHHDLRFSRLRLREMLTEARSSSAASGRDDVMGVRSMQLKTNNPNQQ
jgi:hypothetical protein